MKIEITHHHYHYPAADPPGLMTLSKKLDLVIFNQETIMATLDQVLADVTAETTDIASISTLISGLKQQLADALAGAALPPGTQAKVDAIFATAEANKAAIAAALAVPPAPTPAAPGTA